MKSFNKSVFVEYKVLKVCIKKKRLWWKYWM